jgi:hypothetical protein
VMTVAIRLRLKSSDCTINTGLRYPGSEPTGSGSSAHQMSPRCITNFHHRWTRLASRQVRYREMRARLHKPR